MPKCTVNIDDKEDKFINSVIKSPRYHYPTRQAFLKDFFALMYLDDDFRAYVLNRLRGYHDV